MSGNYGYACCSQQRQANDRIDNLEQQFKLYRSNSFAANDVIGKAFDADSGKPALLQKR